MDYDYKDKLTEIEKQAVALREELANLEVI